MEIGRRVAAFKKLIHKEESRLKGLWNQWDDVQNDYIRLGIEVFGPQAFGDLAAEHPNMQGGYKKDLELLSLEHEANVEALDKEAEEIGATILQEWKNAEKVCRFLSSSQLCHAEANINLTGARFCCKEGAGKTTSSTYAGLSYRKVCLTLPAMARHIVHFAPAASSQSSKKIAEFTRQNLQKMLNCSILQIKVGDKLSIA